MKGAGHGNFSSSILVVGSSDRPTELTLPHHVCSRPNPDTAAHAQEKPCVRDPACLCSHAACPPVPQMCCRRPFSGLARLSGVLPSLLPGTSFLSLPVVLGELLLHPQCPVHKAHRQCLPAYPHRAGRGPSGPPLCLGHTPELGHMRLNRGTRGCSGLRVSRRGLARPVRVTHLVTCLLRRLAFESLAGKDSGFLSCSHHSLTSGPGTWSGPRECLSTCFGESG